MPPFVVPPFAVPPPAMPPPAIPPAPAPAVAEPPLLAPLAAVPAVALPPLAVLPPLLLPLLPPAVVSPPVPVEPPEVAAPPLALVPPLVTAPPVVEFPPELGFPPLPEPPLDGDEQLQSAKPRNPSVNGAANMRVCRDFMRSPSGPNSQAGRGAIPQPRGVSKIPYARALIWAAAANAGRKILSSLGRLAGLTSARGAGAHGVTTICSWCVPGISSVLKSIHSSAPVLPE